MHAIMTAEAELILSRAYDYEVGLNGKLQVLYFRGSGLMIIDLGQKNEVIRRRSSLDIVALSPA